MSLFRNLDPLAEDSSPDATAARAAQPLAERLRPETLDDFAGQEHLLGPGKPLRVQIERDAVQSMILWGPPGCGKTTLARIIARMTRSDFLPFSAVLAGIKEIKQVMKQAESARHSGRRTIVFIDEVHRFNKAQQDAFLPYVEQGSVVLIGATTENPSFEVIAPLLSRARVYRLEALGAAQVAALLRRAVDDKERGLGAANIEIPSEVVERIAAFANGDARAAYNALEAVVAGTAPDENGKRVITAQALDSTLQKRALLYDKAGEEHFNIISALHKSVRNSDPDAALYWLGRMLEAGEDPLYVARRLVRMASEDIGLADPGALALSIAAMQAAHFLGPPEGNLALAEAAVYLAIAPKSNAVYLGYGQVCEDLQKKQIEPVPLHLRNAVTGMMREFGYGKGYQYAHDAEGKVSDMECLPESLRGRRYYLPTAEGREARIRERLEEIRKMKSGKRAEKA